MNYYKLLLFLTLSIVTLNSCKQPQLIDDGGFVALNVVETNYLEDGSVSLSLNYLIKDSYHIQAFELEDSNFIPTELRVVLPEPLEVISQSQDFEEKKLSFDGQRYFEVISDSLRVNLIIGSRNKLPLDNTKVRLRLFYQACDDKKCFFPRLLENEISLNNHPSI